MPSPTAAKASPRFRLTSDISAFLSTDRALQIIRVPRDSIMEICGEEYGSSMVNVKYSGIVLSVYASDLEYSCERLDPAESIKHEKCD